MNEREFQDFLMSAIDDAEDGARVSTFDDCGMLTRNKGLVVTMEDGSEFQVTIVQSEAADEDDDEDDI